MTPRQAEALAELEKHGSIGAAAKAMGLHRTTVKELVQKARRDPAINQAMEAVGTAIVPSVAWLKTPEYSVMVRPQVDPMAIADEIKSAFVDMPAATPVAAPEHYNEDLLTVYPIADAHIGMMAWGREAGEDYDTSIAVERIRQWIGRAVDASPASAEAIILDVGDLTHADDQTNQTPKSKHVLDVDTRHFRTLEMTIAALAYAIEYALHRHARVTVRILPGNHNLTSYMAVMFALAERYRDEPRVTVQKVPGEFFVHRFGDCFISAHHGHGGKPERMVLFLADEYASDWGRTRHRFLFTGHMHHHKSADIGGVTWEQLRAVTSRDAYAVGNAYTARAQLQAITLHRHKGEIQRSKVSA